MPLSHSIGINLSGTGTASASFVAEQTADGSANYQVVIAPAASNFSIVCPIKASVVKSIVMYADAAMTVVTKSGASTVNTFALVANKPLIWQTGYPVTCPITGDCDTLSVTSTPGGNLNLSLLEDV